MVTAETAVVLPVLLLVLAGAVAAVTVVGAQLRCVDAAREGARAAARGEPDATVSRLVGELSPDGAATRVSGDADDVRVTVTVRVAPLGPLPLRVTRLGRGRRRPGAGQCRGRRMTAPARRRARLGHRLGDRPLHGARRRGSRRRAGRGRHRRAAPRRGRGRPRRTRGRRPCRRGRPGACGLAAEVARENTATLVSCSVGGDAVVELRVSVPVRLGRLGCWAARARARAGPVPAGLGIATRSSSSAASTTGPPGRRGQLVEDDVEHPHRAGLVQRVVAVAALGRLHARRAAALALAARDGGPGRLQPPRSTANPRSLKPAPPGWPSYTKIVAVPVSGCSAVERPPRSQRSQVASSGRMPMAACSAACSEPGSSTSSSSARSTARSSRVSQTARVRSWRAGRSSGNSASTSPVPSRRRW